MAYWLIQHGTAPGRAALSTPAAYVDLLQGALVARGIDPSKAGDGDSPSEPARAPSSRSGPGIGVRVHGGAESPAMRRVAENWHRANMPKDWSKRTGSTPPAIAWALKAD